MVRRLTKATAGHQSPAGRRRLPGRRLDFCWHARRAGAAAFVPALLYPDKKFKDLKFPEVEEQNHWGRYVEACLGGAKTTANFDYSGPLAEAVLVGTVALRFPKTTLNWNAAR